VDLNSNTAHGSTHEDDNVFTECIDTMAEANDPRYRVYCKDQCLLTNNMETVTCLLSGSRQHGIKIRGVAELNKHFCSLYPMNEQPNFAGAKAIGQFT
jgi:hypothetical protein